jgi:hypothetical protein
MISFWYSVDNDYPDAAALIAQHTGNVTSVFTYCDLTVSDAGMIIGTTLSPQCSGFFANLTALGVRGEIVLNGGNCSIDAYRTLWADKTNSPAQLAAFALSANLSGINVDFEPQADNCQGAPTGTQADAQSFAAWLTAVRSLLSPHGIRLTVDVASWSPVLSQYAVLAGAVDRLENMETYNGDSQAEWEGYYEAFINAVPREKAGVGLGGWTDGKGSWWETPAGAAAKVARATADGVPELAVFRIVPSPEQNPSWPLDFWWGALAAYH